MNALNKDGSIKMNPYNRGIIDKEIIQLIRNTDINIVPFSDDYCYILSVDSSQWTFSQMSKALHNFKQFFGEDKKVVMISNVVKVTPILEEQFDNKITELQNYYDCDWQVE